MINDFLFENMDDIDPDEMWFQQDGATCHTATATIDLLKSKFGDKLISRNGPFNFFFLYFVLVECRADFRTVLAHRNCLSLISSVRGFGSFTVNLWA